jgi:hypothetical protein
VHLYTAATYASQCSVAQECAMCLLVEVILTTTCIGMAQNQVFTALEIQNMHFKRGSIWNQKVKKVKEQSPVRVFGQ